MAERASSPPDEKPIGELMSDLSHQVSALVHDEVQLATAELKEKGKRAGLGTGMLGGAGFTAAFGIACMTACVIAALHLALPVWLSCLIVACLYLMVAGGLGLLGRKELKRATPPVPTVAIEDTKEELAWLKTQAKSANS